MKRTIDDLQLQGRKVFIRVDFNVPIKNGVIGDDTKIRASLPTIKRALERGAATVILASHLGRPKGKPSAELSLRPVAERLSDLLGRPVTFAADCTGEEAQSAVAKTAPGGIVLLENLRFHVEEEENEPGFAKALASLADVYVNDAFGSAHRAHASTEGIVRHVTQAAAGLLMAREVEYLGRVLESPDRPFVAVLGGAKVSDKLEVIKNLLEVVDCLLVGGAAAYTFFKARGLPVGRSPVDDKCTAVAQQIELRAAERKIQLGLPTDHVVADSIEAGASHEVIAVDDPAIGTRIGVDIGPATIATYTRLLATARMVFWNGPMGVFEVEAFAAGTNAIARAVGQVKGTTILGGGDSISSVIKAGVADRITHFSTGGGASLEFLAGRVLPGVAALPDRE